MYDITAIKSVCFYGFQMNMIHECLLSPGAHPDSLHNLLTGKSDEMDLTTSFSSLKTCIMEALQV